MTMIILEGPNGLQVNLDKNTVYKAGNSATRQFAIQTGELTGYQGFTQRLTPDEIRWLKEIQPAMGQWFPKTGLK